jgi:hypothetical protein
LSRQSRGEDRSEFAEGGQGHAQGDRAATEERSEAAGMDEAVASDKWPIGSTSRNINQEDTA